MKAAILRAHGEADQIGYGDWPDPAPGPGERADRDPRRVAEPARLVDHAKPGPRRRALHPRLRLRGRGAERRRRRHAVAPGDEVLIYPGFRWGDREDAPQSDFEILGVPHQGVFAEQIAVPDACVFAKPAHLSFAEAACIGIAGLTTWRGLVTRGGVTDGSTVLVTGAAAGTGTFAIQIATALGARVYVTTSSSEKLARCKALGALDGVDWRDPAWPDRIRELTGGGVDVALDSAGGDTWDPILRALRPGGTLVNFGDTAGEFSTIPVASVYWEQRSIHGSTMGSPREFATLLEHVALDPWRPVIDSTFPLERTDDAFRRLDDPARFGKIVLAIS